MEILITHSMARARTTMTLGPKAEKRAQCPRQPIESSQHDINHREPLPTGHAGIDR